LVATSIMNYAIVDKSSLKILNVYWSDNGPDPSRIDDTQVQLLVPENFDYFCIKATDLNTIVEDPNLVSIKNNKKMNDIRVKRDQLLSQSDWTQFNDSPLNTETRAVWATYRQALRDLPENTSDPTQVVWPTPPS